MSLLVTGTIGIDTVETPHGRAEDVLGGSAAYFSLAACLFAPVRLVGVVGDDFPEAYRDAFKNRPIDMAGLEVRHGSKTFRWHGKYLDDMNERETLRTDLNVVSEAPPTIPASFRDSAFVFLANTHPVLQREFIAQLASPRLVVCDTMDFWIAEFRDELIKTLGAVHGVVLNDSEARMLTGENDLVAAGRAVLKHGPAFAIIKKGEHGAMLVTPDGPFVQPAYPAVRLKDPTGAGDSFAGGMMGHLAAVDRIDDEAVKSAIAWGTCVASITIEGYSINSIAVADRRAVDARREAFKKMMAFE